MSPADQALLASLLAGLATALGGAVIVAGGRLPHRAFDGLVGFAAGIMLAISAHEMTEDVASNLSLALVAASIGGLAVLGIRALPHLALPITAHLRRRGNRVAVGITVHNLVEGLMIVAAYERAGTAVGLGVAVAIAAHNIPEGLAVAGPLRGSGMSGRRCLLLTAASGLGEPLGALLAVAALGTLLPIEVGGALAAGAMIVLAAIELIPEAFSHSYVREGAVGLLGGTVIALGLVAGA